MSVTKELVSDSGPKDSYHCHCDPSYTSTLKCYQKMESQRRVSNLRGKMTHNVGQLYRRVYEVISWLSHTSVNSVA